MNTQNIFRNDTFSEDVFNIFTDLFRDGSETRENVRPTYSNSHTNSHHTNPQYDASSIVIGRVMSEYNANMLEYNINMREYMIRANIRENNNFVDYHNNIDEYSSNIRRFLDLYRNNNRHDEENRRYANRENTRNRNYGLNTNNRVRGLYSNYTPTQLLSYFLPNRNFTNVIVRPSEEQISNATQMLNYDENASYNNNSRPITMEDFSNGDVICQIKHCGHNFREQPLRNWFRTNVRCPVCRYDIREYSVSGGGVVDTNNVDTETNEETPETPEYNSNTTTTNNNITRPNRNPISNIIQNYLAQHVTPFVEELNSELAEFDIVVPIIYYNDNSGNRNHREPQI